MTMKLLPCPFCGGEAEFSIGKTGDGKDWHYIECGDCGALGPRVNYADHNIRVKETNAEAWNQRQPAPRLGTSFPGNETFDDEPGRA